MLSNEAVVVLKIFRQLMAKNSRNPFQTHIWELPGNYPVFIMVMIIYHYVEKIWRIIVTPNFCITYIIKKKYYPNEPVNIRIQLLINIIQNNNWVISTKNTKSNLPLFSDDGERVIPIYVNMYVVGSTAGLQLQSRDCTYA